MAFPPAQGARIPWEALPDSVREAVEAGLGARVLEAVTQPGGFSPGVAVRLRLDDGRRAFVKAVGSSPNPHSPEIHRREATLAAALPPETPAPRFLFAHDDGDWVALASSGRFSAAGSGWPKRTALRSSIRGPRRISTSSPSSRPAWRRPPPARRSSTPTCGRTTS